MEYKLHTQVFNQILFSSMRLLKYLKKEKDILICHFLGSKRLPQMV